MKPNTVLPSLVSLCGLWLTFNGASAQAETVQCKELPPLPTTIDNWGVYCLKSNRTIDVPLFFAAITINTNNVVIDLNGFKLRGRGAPDSHDIGIFCTNCRNITIRNGTVQGFSTGIFLGTLTPSTSEANLIEDIRAVGNSHIGIAASGNGVLVRNNHVVNTGGNAISNEAIGIQGFGTGIRVINNDIVTVRQPAGVGRGIYFVTGDGFLNPPDNLAINNRINNAAVGIEYFESAGKFRDNLTSSVAAPYIGGTDAGNNN